MNYVEMNYVGLQIMSTIVEKPFTADTATA